MNNWMAQKLLPHVGHDISCVTYGDSEDPDDVCIECDECGTVLVSAEDFEADMAGDYKITHQLRIGGRTLVLGHNPEDHETPFLVCYQDYGLGFPRFTEAVGGDDYLEIVELFSLRLQQQIEAVKQQRAERNLPFTALTREHCRRREPEESLEGKLVIVKASNISPEYRSADYQLGYATGGFGCKPGAGAVRCSLRSSTPGSGAAGTLATSWASLTWTSCRSGQGKSCGARKRGETRP